MAKRPKRNRKKLYRQNRDPLRKTPRESPVGYKVDALSWPIVKAYVPVEDVFLATGYGTAGIVRQRPDGLLSYSVFTISLSDQGVKTIFGKDKTNEEEIDELFTKLGSNIPPFEVGSPELAAQYIWGAYALSLSSDYKFDSSIANFLPLVPILPGRSSSWVEKFIGPSGLAAPGLVKFLHDHPIPDDIPEDKEVLIWTRATFSCDDVSAVRDELNRREPEFGDLGESDDGVERFEWSRAYPKNHWSPLSQLGGRQSLGSVELHADQIVAEAKVLSMASILIGKLKHALGDQIKLTDTQWLSSDDLCRINKSRG